MRLLFDDEMSVHYGQAYVECDWEIPEDPLTTAFAGQVNGLCGAASPGFLFMITGLHTGGVGFTVEFHDEAPPVDDIWEDVVEVSFRPTSETVALVGGAGGATWPLDLEQVDLRARYCARGMDQARVVDTRLEGQPEVDRYLLQLWPGPPEPDRVLRQTSAHAAYWHGFARQLPPPPSPEELAELERQAELEGNEQLRRFEDLVRWGGHPPSERLRNVGGNARGLLDLDRYLVEAIAEAAPDVQRAIARWAARRAYDAAGLSALDWVAPALEALEHGEELPPPFDDQAQVWRVLFGEDRVFAVVLGTTEPDPGHMPDIAPEAAAVPALFAAVEANPLRAAVDALYAAAVTFGDQHPLLFADLRRTFPAIT